jgi:hypothetical protein
MRRFPDSKFVLMALFPFLAVAICPAVSPDPKILSLVPPGAQLVAGVSASPGPERISNFILMTHNNRVDLNDFYALSGVDSTRAIDEIIFVAVANKAGMLSEHSLLVSGRFDQARIYKAALENGAALANYGGIRVLVIPPFARERRDFNEVRWLVVPDPDVLLFGSIASVQQELERHLAGSTADSALVRKLAHLRRDDETWCVLTPLTWGPEMRNALAVIDPQVPAGLRDGDAFQFGIRHGRQVEFEYELTLASTAITQTISDLLTQSFAGPENGSAFLPHARITSDGNTVRGLIKVSIPRYSAWLAEMRAGGTASR